MKAWTEDPQPERRTGPRTFEKPSTPVLDALHAESPCDGKVVTHSQLIGQFLDWLNEEGIHLAKWGHEFYSDPISRRDLPKDERGSSANLPAGVSYQDWLDVVVSYRDREGTEDRLIPIHEGPSQLLHRYFKVDPNAEENERRAILDAIRAANAEPTVDRAVDGDR